MRTTIIAGNWKMNTTVSEAMALVKAMRNKLEAINGVEKVLCPPFVSLTAVRELILNSSLKLGAQNMHFEEKGAYTGEVSPLMLAGLCQYVVLGHSERRQYFGESDEIVNKKVQAALKVGLKPIICVGEKLEEREKGLMEEVITRQVKGALASVPSLERVVVAYEPIWAIGTGRAATGEQANDTISIIRHEMGRLYGAAQADMVPIQYGGSVTGANVAEFLCQKEIDGALVGGASLKADEFIAIVEQTAAVKGKK
ncbi:MAG: triose-phosphate isomerase [Chloroflexi bacterium]|nr:triose-phosphate isomerase [Chloroflexota bacterium]